MSPTTLTVQERRVAAGQCPVCARRLDRKGECPAAPHDWTGKRPPEQPFGRALDDIPEGGTGHIEINTFQGGTFYIDGPEDSA